MTASPTVLIVAARCGECGFDNEQGLYHYGLFRAFPVEVPVSDTQVPARCRCCGGQVLLSQALPGEEGA